MYYISAVYPDTVDITDTSDGVTERYKKVDVPRMGIPIVGVSYPKFTVYSNNILNLACHKELSGCKISFSGGETYRDCLYVGFDPSVETFYFYDGSGASGLFQFSVGYLMTTDRVKISFEHISDMYTQRLKEDYHDRFCK